jgi:L-threonylcarbamoyladenylate synthase
VKDEVRRAAEILRAGRLVAFPTETVYGLGADASNPAAIALLYAVKRRPMEHPVIVHFAHAEPAFAWTREVPETARKLAAPILAGTADAGAQALCARARFIPAAWIRSAFACRRIR